MPIQTATFDEYLRLLDPSAVATVRRLLDLMRAQFGEAEEVVQWGIAFFRYRETDLAGIAARKKYYSLYIPHSELLAAWTARLGTVNTGRGCVRFRHEDDLDTDALSALLADVYRRARSL